MSNILETLFPRMGTVELVQEVALLSFVKGNNSGKEAIEAITTFRIVNELYHRAKLLADPHAQLRALTVLKICDYVNKHPNASQSELKKMMEKTILEFAQAVQKSS